MQESQSRRPVEGNSTSDEVQARRRWRLLSRRRFLEGSGLAGLAAVLFPTPIRRLLPSVLRTEAQAATLPEPLSEQDLGTLLAFAYVLIPSSFRSKRPVADPVLKDVLQQHATDAAFHAAATLLESKTFTAYQVRFDELSTEQHRRLMNDLLKPYTERSLFATPYYYFTQEGRRIRSLWHAVAKPIITDFYTSPLGWQVVGNPGRPGECSNLTDYQFPGSFPGEA